MIHSLRQKFFLTSTYEASMNNYNLQTVYVGCHIWPPSRPKEESRVINFESWSHGNVVVHSQSSVYANQTRFNQVGLGKFWKDPWCYVSGPTEDLRSTLSKFRLSSAVKISLRVTAMLRAFGIFFSHMVSRLAVLTTDTSSPRIEANRERGVPNPQWLTMTVQWYQKIRILEVFKKKNTCALSLNSLKSEEK